MDFSHRQLCISEELDSPNMRAEAYLNLARAHERLGALDRALGFARHRYTAVNKSSFRGKKEWLFRCSTNLANLQNVSRH